MVLAAYSHRSHPVLLATWLRGELKEREQPRAGGKHALERNERRKGERQGTQYLITNVDQDTLDWLPIIFQKYCLSGTRVCNSSREP